MTRTGIALAITVALAACMAGSRRDAVDWKPIRFAAFRAPLLGSNEAALASAIAVLHDERDSLRFLIVMGPLLEPGTDKSRLPSLGRWLGKLEIPTYVVLTPDDDADQIVTGLHASQVVVARGPYNVEPPSAPGVLVNVLDPEGRGEITTVLGARRVIQVRPMEITVRPMEIHHPYERLGRDSVVPDLIIRRSQWDGGGSDSSFLWGPYYQPRGHELVGGADLELLPLAKRRPIAIVTLWVDHATLEALSLSGEREVVYREGVPLPPLR